MKGVIGNRLIAVFSATVVFSVLGLFAAWSLKMPMGLALIGAPLLGLAISGFEVFYFQGYRGRWLRDMHPLKSIMIYALFMVVMGLAIQHLNYLAQGRWHDLPKLYERYPVVIPVFLTVAIFAVMVIRIIGFIGGKNILYLLIGKYHRPVWERKVFLFLDIKGSTNLVDALGPEKSKLLFGKFMFDASDPIAANGGEIYRYQGDGFVAIWNWQAALGPGGIAQAVDDLYAMIEREQADYEARFGTCPDFRIGIHGGKIITSEEGDIRRNIGFYGDTINIAARMEAKAKDVSMDCVVTSDVIDMFGGLSDRLSEIGEESVRGIERDIAIHGFNRL